MNALEDKRGISARAVFIDKYSLSKVCTVPQMTMINQKMNVLGKEPV